MDFARNHRKRRIQNMLWIVGWVVVNNAKPGMFKPTFQEARGFFALGLNVRNVSNRRFRERTTIVDHPLKNEGGNAVVGPPMLKGQALDDDKRQLVLIRQRNGVLQGVIPLGSSSSRHPINDHVTVFIGNAVYLEAAVGNHCEAPLRSVSAMLVR